MRRATSSGAKDWREGRRLRALELVGSGYAQAEVARVLGVTAGAVSQWVKRARAGGGPEALRRRTGAGGRRKLPLELVDALPGLLGRPPSAYGLAGERWTVRAVAALVEATWGVSVSPSHASRLVKLGRSRRRRGRGGGGGAAGEVGELTDPCNAARRAGAAHRLQAQRRVGGHVAGAGRADRGRARRAPLGPFGELRAWANAC
jgi:transposase